MGISETWIGPTHPPECRWSTKADRDECMALASAAFAYDRLHADPTVPQAEADEAKRIWVQQAFATKDRCIFVWGKPVKAFLITQSVRGVMTIELIAVSEDMRKQGIASKLIEFASWRTGAICLRASTQATNEPAKALYASLGMSVVTRERTLHQ